MTVETASLESRALRATLDRFAIGVAIVGEEARILHVNDAARSMLDDGAHVRTLNGRLFGASPEATDKLLRAIRIVQRDETAAGASGIGVALPGRDGGVATAHVLPLGPAGVEARPATEPTAAVFLARAGSHAQPDLTVIAQSYGLTRAEVRLLGSLIEGRSLVEAAVALDVSESTARTHLKHLFAKTGVSRQADLIALVHRLLPPVRRS